MTLNPFTWIFKLFRFYTRMGITLEWWRIIAMLFYCVFILAMSADSFGTSFNSLRDHPKDAPFVIFAIIIAIIVPFPIVGKLWGRKLGLTELDPIYRNSQPSLSLIGYAVGFGALLRWMGY